MPGHCSDLLEYFERMVRSLEVTHRQFEALTKEEGPFFKLSRELFDDVLQDLRSELEGQVVVAVVARAEAVLRADAESRLQSRAKAGGVLSAFKALKVEQGERKRLADIVAIWRQAAGGSEFKFQEFYRLQKQRHWYAHGKYWTVKAGPMLDPPQAAFIVDEVLDAIVGVDAGFPR